MNDEIARRMSYDLQQLRIISDGAWHIICNWRVEVGTPGALSMLKAALDLIDRHSRELRRDLEVLMPSPQLKAAPPVRKFTHREHPRGVRGRCRGTRKDGKPCGSRVEGCSAFCRRHQEQAHQGSLDEIAALVVNLGHLLPETHQNDDINE